MLEVYVTFLDKKPVPDAKTRGQKMAEILENIAATEGLENIYPILWQR